MKFYNIGDTKLKVVLSADECVTYGIDTAKTEFQGREIKAAMRDILSLAEDECGFTVTSEKLLVQLYPMPSGECEVFVTKLTGLSHRDKRALLGTHGLATLEKRSVVYRFDSRSDLVSAVRAIYTEGVECRLYRDGEDRYYISVDEELTDGVSELEVLIEFSDRLTDMPIHLLSEYATLISDTDTLERIRSGDF